MHAPELTHEGVFPPVERHHHPVLAVGKVADCELADKRRRVQGDRLLKHLVLAGAENPHGARLHTRLGLLAQLADVNLRPHKLVRRVVGHAHRGVGIGPDAVVPLPLRRLGPRHGVAQVGLLAGLVAHRQRQPMLGVFVEESGDVEGIGRAAPGRQVEETLVAALGHVGGRGQGGHLHLAGRPGVEHRGPELEVARENLVAECRDLHGRGVGREAEGGVAVPVHERAAGGEHGGLRPRRLVVAGDQDSELAPEHLARFPADVRERQADLGRPRVRLPVNGIGESPVAVPAGVGARLGMEGDVVDGGLHIPDHLVEGQVAGLALAVGAVGIEPEFEAFVEDHVRVAVGVVGMILPVGWELADHGDVEGVGREADPGCSQPRLDVTRRGEHLEPGQGHGPIPLAGLEFPIKHRRPRER
ncbi:MAG: hypothetical protein BWZ02_00001 [Lentisphaerae bacterium ADurb.BinA184]|nr:MAG: hypothetical protein BWZ02_00001 [Lentisphaerae bacterium ADurb.BinA184]